MKYGDQDSRWQAVLQRDNKANRQFYYAVKTTGVYCLPSCKARTPKRDNVVFYDSCESAQRGGFRPCKRCRPNDMHPPHYEKILKAIQLIEESEEEPSLDELAESAGLSASYFNRVFKAQVGLTPKQYAIACRTKKTVEALKSNDKVTSAIYDAGYNASSRYYESANQRHGMTATERRNGAKGIEIRFAFGKTSLGRVIVAATEKGICSVMIGQNNKDLLTEVKAEFPDAVFIRAEPGSDFDNWVAETLNHLDNPNESFDLPLDIQGTVFQERVWRALKDIPCGQTRSYKEIATAIGKPDAFRAVARACASNKLAVIVPCHRVVRADGGLSGYRWGTDVKRTLLEQE